MIDQTLEYLLGYLLEGFIEYPTAYPIDNDLNKENQEELFLGRCSSVAMWQASMSSAAFKAFNHRKKYTVPVMYGCNSFTTEKCKNKQEVFEYHSK